MLGSWDIRDPVDSTTLLRWNRCTCSAEWRGGGIDKGMGVGKFGSRLLVSSFASQTEVHWEAGEGRPGTWVLKGAGGFSKD
jgi:hypothetical protein